MTQTATPLIGLGATLSIGTQGGTPVFTPINGIKKITPPQPKFGVEDVTTLSTPNTGRRKVKTLIDNGEIKIEGEWESADAGQTALAAALATVSNSTNGADYPFKLALPVDLAGGQVTTGDLLAFNAMVTEFSISDVEIEKTITFSATLTIDGPLTFTPGA